MNITKKHKILIAIVAFVILISVILLSLFITDADNISEEDTSQIGSEKTVDPVSGEAYATFGDEHEMFDGEGGIAFLGLGQLIDRGLSVGQITYIKENFEALSLRLDTPIKVVSIYQDSVARYMPVTEDGPMVVEFKVKLNHSDDYVVGLEYKSTNQIDTFKFYDESKATLLHEI